MTLFAVSAIVNARPVLVLIPVFLYGCAACRGWASKMERRGKL